MVGAAGLASAVTLGRAKPTERGLAVFEVCMCVWLLSDQSATLLAAAPLAAYPESESMQHNVPVWPLNRAFHTELVRVSACTSPLFSGLVLF